ncbi:hypothetical protein RUND412_007547 [Rhizina undulata]
MFHSPINNATVDNSNNRIYKSGNTNSFNNVRIENLNYNPTFNSSTGVNEAHGSIRNDFAEFNVPVKLPFAKNPNFCGRRDILDRMHGILAPDPNIRGSSSSRKTVVLHGMGGIGKSQIALEYACRFSDEYTSIFWIDADDISLVKDSAFQAMEQLKDHYATRWRSSPDFREIAHTLGITGRINDLGKFEMDGSLSEVAMKRLHDWLSKSKNQGWLLLIDNIDKVEEGYFNELLPPCPFGRVIITSRLSNLHSIGECIEIEGFGARDGLELLEKISGKAQQNLENSERGEAREIVKRLGELPLAINQAGVYIFKLKIKFATFRERMHDATTFPIPLKPDRASIPATFELSFKELSLEAKNLLQICAFLRNEDIPDELFRRGKNAVPWMKDENKLDEAIGSLFAFSLAKRKGSGDSFWIHPLMHSWVRDRNNYLTQRKIAEDTISLLGASIEKNKHKRRTDDWIFERRISIHLEGLERIPWFSSDLDNFSIKVADALSSIASAYENLGFYKQAEAQCLRAITVYEKELEENHPSSLDTLHCMGAILWKQNRYDDALNFYRRALSGKEESIGAGDPSTLCTVNAMALVFDSKLQFDEALKLHNRALEGIGSDNRKTPEYLDTVNSIAWNYLRQGLYDKSLEWFQTALEGREGTLGQDHPSTISTLFNIANIFYCQERYEEALERYQKILLEQERTLGKDHSETLNTVHNIANVFYYLERHEESLEWYLRTLAGEEKTLEKDHRDILITVHEIGNVFYKQEKYEEAQEWYQRALDGREKVLGKAHRDTLATLAQVTAVDKILHSAKPKKKGWRRFL